LTVADGRGLASRSKLVAALERGQIKSLKHPIEIGEPGNSDAWLIV
jgi:hypothetical protein